jgi:cholesterol transport system auxiliary component
MNPNPLPRGRRIALATLLAGAWPVLFAGCGASLLPKPPAAAARFTLDDAAPAIAPIEPAVGAPTLLVAVPLAAPGFDSRHMVYLRRPQELQAYAFHEWVDTPAQMLAPLLVRALQGSGAYGAVLMAPSSASAGLRLETTLIRLQQDFASRPSQVRLTLRVVLLDAASRQVIAWQEFDERVPAPSDDAAGGVVAARLATRQVVGALVAFGTARARV